jgi:hypothetical protein
MPTPADTPKRDRPEIHGAGQLVEFDDSDFDYRRQVWIALEAEREAVGYREGWSFFRFKERFGAEPVIAAGDLIDPPNATADQKRTVFEHFTEIAQAKGFKPGWASHRYRNIFGCWPKGFVNDVRNENLRERWIAREEASA